MKIGRMQLADLATFVRVRTALLAVTLHEKFRWYICCAFISAL